MENFTIEKNGTEIEITISNIFTIDSVSAIKQQLHFCQDSTIHLTVKMLNIENIDIAAIQLLISLQMMIERNGGTTRFIQNKSFIVQNFLQKSGLNRYISLN